MRLTRSTGVSAKPVDPSRSKVRRKVGMPVQQPPEVAATIIKDAPDISPWHGYLSPGQFMPRQYLSNTMDLPVQRRTHTVRHDPELEAALRHHGARADGSCFDWSPWVGPIPDGWEREYYLDPMAGEFRIYDTETRPPAMLYAGLPLVNTTGILIRMGETYEYRIGLEVLEDIGIHRMPSDPNQIDWPRLLGTPDSLRFIGVDYDVRTRTYRFAFRAERDTQL